MFKHTKVLGLNSWELILNYECIVITEGKPVQLMGSDYITPMQEPTFVSTSVLSQPKFRQSSLMGKRGEGTGREGGQVRLNICNFVKLQLPTISPRDDQM